jgi:ferredoxin
MAQPAKQWREKLRTFHLTGRGLEEWAPRGPLWPAAAADLAGVNGAGPAPGMLAREYVAAAEPRRRLARNRLGEKYEALARRLRLLLEEAPRGNAPEEFGVEGSQLLDAAALRALRRPSASRGSLPAARQERIRTALAALDQWVTEAPSWPVAFLYAPGEEREPYAAAVRQQRELLDQFSAVHRAAETARLEADGHFDPELHAERIAREDWQSAAPEELEALPAVAVCDTAQRLLDDSLTAFAATLRTGLPVQVLVEFAPDGFEPDLTATALAHPEAFVVQTSAACLEELRQGLARMAASLRPGACFCAGGATAREAALAARAGVFARFTSAAGQIEVSAGAELTPAHAAAAFERFRAHFRVLPAEAQDAEQLEAGEYLARYGAEAPLAIPYVEVAEGRAAFTRELAWWCHERMLARGRIEEQRRPAPSASAAVAEAPAPAPEAAPPAPDALEQARRQGAGEAVQRLVAALLGTTPIAVAEASQPAGGDRAAAAAPAEAAAPSAAAESEEPWVASYLCTSCNDCLKVNDRMFRYNADNQIYLADASKGTYAELVKAAEACPAKCIHPGSPRPDDATATPAVRARAAKLAAAR